MAIEIDYQPPETNEGFHRHRYLRNMGVVSIPCVANIVLIAALLFDRAFGDKDFGAILTLSMCALPFVGAVAATIGILIFLYSAATKTFLTYALAMIFALTLLCGMKRVPTILCFDEWIESWKWAGHDELQVALRIISDVTANLQTAQRALVSRSSFLAKKSFY